MRDVTGIFLSPWYLRLLILYTAAGFVTNCVEVSRPWITPATFWILVFTGTLNFMCCVLLIDIYDAGGFAACLVRWIESKRRQS